MRSRSIAFDGVVPVSAMKARVKCRALMPARSARSSTVSGASRCSRAQVSSGPKRPVRRLQFQQRRELRLAAAAAMIEHELARGLLRDLVAVILRDHRERQIDAGGDAGRAPDIAVAHEDAVGLELHLRIGGEKLPRALPMGGGAAAVEQAGFGEHEGAGADAGDADAALGDGRARRSASLALRAAVDALTAGDDQRRDRAWRTQTPAPSSRRRTN